MNPKSDASATSISSPNSQPVTWSARPLARLAISTLVTWSVLGVYMLINHHQSSAPTTVLMPTWVPFLPSFIVPYFGMLLLTWLLPVSISDPERFRACLTAFICAFALIIPWWILTPTMLPRPPLPEGAWASALGFIWTLDAPCNVTPCGHGTGPIIAAWFASQGRPTWRWPLVAILAVGLSSIAFTWQHRPIDILLGAIAAAIGIAVAEILRRKRLALNRVCHDGSNKADHAVSIR